MKEINFWLHIKIYNLYTNYGTILVEIVNVRLFWFQSVIFENNQKSLYSTGQVQNTVKFFIWKIYKWIKIFGYFSGFVSRFKKFCR